jgi:UDP-N-acetyl-D-mannosaminuronic acid transferase (WecB/TagA/CpsF family)
MPKNTTLLGIPLYNGTYSEFFAKIENPVSKTLVFTPNPEILVRASRESEFMEILTRATSSVPDANGLYIGYMMQEGKSFFMAGLRTFFMRKSVQTEYGELIKGSDLVRDILEKRV